jgi:hypothetical protein
MEKEMNNTLKVKVGMRQSFLVEIKALSEHCFLSASASPLSQDGLNVRPYGNAFSSRALNPSRLFERSQTPGPGDNKGERG